MISNIILDTLGSVSDSVTPLKIPLSKARSVHLPPVVDVTAGFAPLFPSVCPNFPWWRFPLFRRVFLVILFIRSENLRIRLQALRILEDLRLGE